MIYNYLLFFLGIYSWEFKSTNVFNRLFQKKIINENPSILIRNNNKKLIDVISNVNNMDYLSPNLPIYLNSFNFNKINISKSFLIYIFYLYIVFAMYTTLFSFITNE